MELWEEFRQLDYSNEILMIFGALLLLFGVMRIIRTSFSMLMWVLLCGLGAASMAFGFNEAGSPPLFENNPDLTEYVGVGKEISSDALLKLCEKIAEK